ncbi:MAG: class I SAM-dependent methyltransferase [Microlunatus sp.]|nr:class I SAM-dependent methyltransferase [Microlunatus sp.]MDN5770761.1 class I SAM-dependent methyltransferase [Microlunatus sp.]MDN5805549.1 class I SAM-dependent methyltransferase [Microlunatus sp.]
MTARARTTARTLRIDDVPAAFDSAAGTYDRMVNLNPGYHRHLQSAADALVEKLPAGRGLVVVDLGCGSGASTDALVNSMGHRGQRFSALGVDGSSGMLEEARSKSWPTWVSFRQARVEDLSELADTLTSSGAEGNGSGAGSNGSSEGAGGVAGILAAYLFRNVDDRDAVLRSVYDLLTPGGVLVAQDYSVAGSHSARWVWTAVSWSLVIPLSKVINSDAGLYRYLWRSVLDNDTVDQFAGRMLAAGFTEVETRTVAGWQNGILHTYRGRKPE